MEPKLSTAGSDRGQTPQGQTTRGSDGGLTLSETFGTTIGG
jgi:hypothetical protein